MIDSHLARILYTSGAIALPIALFCAGPILWLHVPCGVIAFVLFYIMYVRLISPVVFYALTEDQRFDPDIAPGAFVEVKRLPLYFELNEIMQRCEENVFVAEQIIGYVMDTDGILVTIEVDGNQYYAHANCINILPENVVAVQFEESEEYEEASELDE